MTRPFRLVADHPLACQLVVLAAGALLLAGWPPREGALLLVPLGATAATAAVPLALAGHARLVGPGPLPRSYVVRGSRTALIPIMLRAGILILSAPAAGCLAEAPPA